MRARSALTALGLALAALIVAGCPSPKDAPAPAPTKPAAAAVEGAICKEHGVLEAVCTKCNPALIAVFKAKGDWCEEHGFAESFCPVCHPERGGAPLVDVGSSGEGPADGTKVQLGAKETARLIGLRFDKAVERATTRDVLATARVVYDATRVAQVNPRMPGVVRSIRVDVGATVKVGAPLAVIESAGVGAEQARLQAARMRLEVADANHKRMEALVVEGISSERDLLTARREREEARADVRSAQASLGMVGATAEGGARYTMTSPIAGVVTERRATIGRLVDSTDLAFEIVDPSAMWIELDVPEDELALVRVGQPVTVVLESLAGRQYAGVLSYLAPSVDPRTRTAVARVPIANADGALRANAFGRARIAVSDPSAAVLVPRSAVQRARSVSLVFVRLSEDSFEARRVTVGQAEGDRVSVTGRVKAGDELVTEGSFLLKTETLKESIGAGCCEVD